MGMLEEMCNWLFPSTDNLLKAYSFWQAPCYVLYIINPFHPHNKHIVFWQILEFGLREDR